MRRVTINDVARVAGVAIKTVSRVLNDEPNVRAHTRTRVLEAVKALNYSPSRSARSLAGRRSYLVGLVYEQPSVNYIVDVQHGAMQRCREERFQLIIHPCDAQGDELSREIAALIDQSHVDGLVLTPPTSESAELCALLRERQVPCVRISPDDTSDDSMPFVEMDDQGAAREMTEYLIALGHRRVGFLIGASKQSASQRRLQGYREALKAHGIRYEPTLVKQGKFDFDSGIQCGRQLLALPKPPSAVFASNDDMAAGVAVAAHEMAVEIPGRLSVAGFDDTYIARAIWPPLTTVHQPTYDLAYTAMELLLEVLRHGTVPKSERLAYRIIGRGSTGPLRA